MRPIDVDNRWACDLEHLVERIGAQCRGCIARRWCIYRRDVAGTVGVRARRSVFVRDRDRQRRVGDVGVVDERVVDLLRSIWAQLVDCEPRPVIDRSRRQS